MTKTMYAPHAKHLILSASLVLLMAALSVQQVTSLTEKPVPSAQPKFNPASTVLQEELPAITASNPLYHNLTIPLALTAIL